MSNRYSDILHQLICSLEKAEKRHFKLYIKRNSNNEDLKIIQLFDALDKLSEYDEKLLLKKLPSVGKPQLANLKTHLYKQILASLRLLKSASNIDLQLNEQLDYARILYNKGLKLQSLKILERANELALHNHKYNFLAQVKSLEKKIETLHITRSTHDRAEKLSIESDEVADHIKVVATLSNIALQLYSWYVKDGHARNDSDEKALKKFFRKNLPPNSNELTGFYERLYLYQSYCWYAFIRQDFLMYYRYSQKWIDLFDKEPWMINVETGHYIKGLHNLLNAHFDLRNFQKFEMVLQKFEEFADSELAKQHDNFRIHTFIYIHSARINQHLMTGTFRQGLKLVPYINEKLKEYAQYIDAHRVLVFNYKIASLYFGSGDYNTSIDYLQEIINSNSGLRTDLQCYARLLLLMAHYELQNTRLIEYLMKSVYRFMAKMQNLTAVELELFKFLRHSFKIPVRRMKPEFERLLNNIKHFETTRLEKRAFAYLDIISWLESKLSNKTMGEVIHEKFLRSRHTSPVKEEVL